MVTQNRTDFAVEVQGISKTFENVKAVVDVSFKVPKGSLYALLGPNGAGKTTTLNILSCNLLPDVGDAKILGFSVKNQTEQVRKYIGICPQENVLYEHLTVLENLLFFGKMYDVSKSVLLTRANYLLEKVGLMEKQNVVITKLSGGQKRRVNLLVGLIHDPEVLFLDEPTAGLDPQTRRLIWDYIQELKEQGKTILLTTHYMDEADILSNKIGIMDFGKMIAEGTPDQLKESIGKGDNLIFKLNGPSTNIAKITQDLLDKKEIISVNDLVGEDNSICMTAMNGIGKIGQFVNAFLSQKVLVEHIDIQANSLENVFLALTGRQLRDK